MMKTKFVLFIVALLVMSCTVSRPVIRTTTKTKVSTKKKPTTKTATRPTPKTVTTNSSIETKPKPDSEVNLEATSKVKTYAEEIKIYVDNFKEIAQNNMKIHGIPASITLAQGILESGAGKGKLAISANNHFGIKCHSGWKGESVYHDDDASQECFRKSAGYATDSKYPDKLIGIIERFELYQYDNEVLNRDFKPTKKEVISTPNDNYYTVQQGDTLYSLSKRFNLSVNDLMKLNNMTDNTISIGQQIKIK